MNYILVVDDEEDIRDIYEFALRRAFPLDVVSAGSGRKAVAIIREKGLPEVIISDLKMPDGDGFYLYEALKENNWKIPFVICSTDANHVQKAHFPDIYGYIEKPNIITPVVEIVGSLVTKYEKDPGHVPARISLLLRWGITDFNLYMKLSEARMVKVINAGEAFIPSDAQRFRSKNVAHLYITPQDADRYLDALERNLRLVISTEHSSSTELVPITLESLESVERIASTLGWSPRVIEAARHALNLAIKAVSTEPNILKLIKQKLSNPTSQFSGHVSTLSLLSCGFCYQLGWTSESAQMKMGLAALLHDLTVDEEVYEDVSLWNQAASDMEIKEPEIIKYRNHPADAANLLLSMKNVPPDVEHIILQHHEMKDGNGFPRGLTASRISPLACLFIIVEDMINFLEDSKELEEKIRKFLKHRESWYSSGNFKKVFEAVKESVQKSGLLD